MTDNSGNDFYKPKKKFWRKRNAIGITLLFLALIFLAIFITYVLKSPNNVFYNSKYDDNFPVKRDPSKVKIFLSAAAHDPENPCTFSAECGESIHSNEYIDYIEEMLLRCKFDVKRNLKSRVGKEGIRETALDANDWGADLYYVAHTNAFDNKTTYSLIMTDGKEAMLWGNILKNQRQKIYFGKIKVRTNNELIECYVSDAPTVYDEIVFHDNLMEITWFHENMKMIAENTAKGICDMFVAEYIPEP